MAGCDEAVPAKNETAGRLAQIRMPIEDKVDVNLNQNLWGLVVSYVAVGLSQRYGFHELWWLAFVVSCAMSLSVLVCLVFYSINYCCNKWKKIA
jgi:hypothetical protein